MKEKSIIARCNEKLKEETNDIAKKQELTTSKYIIKALEVLNRLYLIGYDLNRIDKIIISHHEMTKSQEKTEKFRDMLFDEKSMNSLKKAIKKEFEEEKDEEDEELLEMLSDDDIPKNTTTELERIQNEREIEDDIKKKRIDCQLNNEPCNGYDDRNMKYDLSEADCERIFGPGNLFKPKKIKEHLIVKHEPFTFEEVPEDWDWRDELAQLDDDYDKKKNISHRRKVIEEETKEGMERLGLTEEEYMRTDEWKNSWHRREMDLYHLRSLIIGSKSRYITNDLQWPILMKKWKKENPDQRPENYFSSDEHKEYKRLVAEFNKKADEKLAKFDLDNAEEMAWIEEEKRKRGIKEGI